MRGLDTRQKGMFSYVSPESRIPKDDPLRPIREMVDDALKELSADFDALYSHTGRPSIARRSSSGRCCCRCSTPSAPSAC